MGINLFGQVHQECTSVSSRGEAPTEAVSREASPYITFSYVVAVLYIGFDWSRPIGLHCSGPNPCYCPGPGSPQCEYTLRFIHNHRKCSLIFDVILQPLAFPFCQCKKCFSLKFRGNCEVRWGRVGGHTQDPSNLSLDSFHLSVNHMITRLWD